MRERIQYETTYTDMQVEPTAMQTRRNPPETEDPKGRNALGPVTSGAHTHPMYATERKFGKRRRLRHPGPTLAAEHHCATDATARALHSDDGKMPNAP